VSTTQNEAISIWIDRHVEGIDPNWSGRSEVEFTIEPGKVVMTWLEVNTDNVETEHTHTFHGSIMDLTEQISDIRAGG